MREKMIIEVAGVLHDAVQEAVMQCGYADELFQAWRGVVSERETARYGERTCRRRWWLV